MQFGSYPVSPGLYNTDYWDYSLQNKDWSHSWQNINSLLFPSLQNIDWFLFPSLQNIDWFLFPSLQNIDWFLFPSLQNIYWFLFPSLQNIDWFLFPSLQNIDWFEWFLFPSLQNVDWFLFPSLQNVDWFLFPSLQNTFLFLQYCCMWGRGGGTEAKRPYWLLSNEGFLFISGSVDTKLNAQLEHSKTIFEQLLQGVVFY